MPENEAKNDLIDSLHEEIKIFIEKSLKRYKDIGVGPGEKNIDDLIMSAFRMILSSLSNKD